MRCRKLGGRLWEPGGGFEGEECYVKRRRSCTRGTTFRSASAAWERGGG